MILKPVPVKQRCHLHNDPSKIGLPPLPWQSVDKQKNGGAAVLLGGRVLGQAADGLDPSGKPSPSSCGQVLRRLLMPCSLTGGPVGVSSQLSLLLQTARLSNVSRRRAGLRGLVWLGRGGAERFNSEVNCRTPQWKTRGSGPEWESSLSAQQHSACSHPLSMECTFSTAVLHPPGLP